MGSSCEGWSEVVLERSLSEALSFSGLVGVSIENWVVLQRNKFDVHANNEPHIAQTLYMDKVSGRYLHKIFGQTIQEGQLDTPSGLKELTQELFEHSRVCHGFEDDVKVEPDIPLARGFHPYPKKTDPNCQRVFKDPHDEATVCPTCTQAMQWDLDPLSCDFSEFVEAKLNISSIKSEEYTDDSLPTGIEIEEAPLWPEEKKTGKRKKIKYAESDYNSVDEDEDSDAHSSLPKPQLYGSTEVSKNVPILDPEDGVGQDRASKTKRQANKFPCDHCKRTFTRGSSYRKHRALLRRHERSILCKFKECAKPHYSFESLAKHIEKDHNDMLAELDEFIQTPQEIKAMKKAQKCSTCKIYVNGNVMVHRHRALYHELGDFKCADCDQYLLTYYHLVIHNYNQHNRVTPTLEPSSEDLEKVEHEDGSLELIRTRHACPKCEKSYKCDGLWGIHMKVFHSWSVFTCEHCDEMCHYLQDFKAHVDNFHSDRPEIKCPKCAEVISLKENPECFDTHFQACVKTLLSKNSLSPLQCDKCGKNYSTQYQLQCHLDSHEGVERFVCDKCDYGTNLKKVMQDHQKFHLRAEGKTRDETGANLFYHCDQCPKKFACRNYLNRHIKQIHEGIKRKFNCTNCSATFNSNSMLYSHKRRVHGFVSNQTRRGRQSL